MSMPIESSTSSQCDISIVIVSFNTRDVLRDCLLSVYREASSLHVQVIVVDNGSTDGSPEMLEQAAPTIWDSSRRADGISYS